MNFEQLIIKFEGALRRQPDRDELDVPPDDPEPFAVSAKYTTTLYTCLIATIWVCVVVGSSRCSCHKNLQIVLSLSLIAAKPNLYQSVKLYM